MNGKDRPHTDTESDSERSLRALFARAEPRLAPPPAHAEEIRRAVYAEWDAVTGRRALMRRVGGAVAAAAALGAVALLVMNTGTAPTPAAVVARVERVQGTALGSRDGAAFEALRVDAPLAQGSIISTADGQVALRLASGGSLRLAAQTQLRLTGSTEAELVAGALYFDSENAAANGALAVVTAVGTLRDIGTQFMAELRSNRLEVGVRDGRVAIARDDVRADAVAGEKLTVERSGLIRRDAIDVYGEGWAWAERLAPPFEIDGRYLVDFLDWVADQTGRSVAFADADVERTARQTRLTGSIDLEPLPKLAAVLALTDLDYSLEGDRILITSKPL